MRAREVGMDEAPKGARRWWLRAGVAVTLAVVVLSTGAGSRAVRSLGGAQAGAALTGIHKIQHVVVIMQENRSFDNYFGTFPGATGIPMANGKPTVCVHDPVTQTCVAPFVDHYDINGGGPHGKDAANA